MHDEAGSGGGGEPGYLAIHDYDALRAAILADSPEALNGLVMIWKKIAWGTEGLGGDLRPIIEELRDAYATPGSAPAMFAKLDNLQQRIDQLAPDLHHNAEVMNQADLALRAAQREIARLDGDGTTKMVDLRTGKDVRAAEAGRIAYALNNTYGDTKDSLIIPDERGDVASPIPPLDGGSAADGGAGYAAPLPVGGRPTTGSGDVGRRPSDGVRLGGPVRDGRGSSASVPAPDAGRGAPGGGRGSSAGTGSGGSRAGAQVPGVRSGAPLGGSRIPAARGGTAGGVPGSGGASPGGSAPAHGGGHGRAGVTPPGGVPGGPGGGGPGGRDRRIKRTWYEKIEDEFRPRRRGNSPGGEIAPAGEPRSAEPTPGTLGRQKRRLTEEQSRSDGQLPVSNPTPEGFPDELKSHTQKDGTRFEVRRRSSGT